MNRDEFAFFNQQLAAMLRSGVPLEGALKQLCAGMKSGSLRTEFQALEADLAQGIPLTDALGHRKLPEFYVRMVKLGARSNDLPGVLTLVADHYQRTNAIWARLQGLMVYPILVIAVALGLTLMLSLIMGHLLETFFDFSGIFGQGRPAEFWAMSIWIPPILLGLLALIVAAVLMIPSWRARLRWRLPAFREASVAQVASALAILLKNGTTLAESLAIAQCLEAETSAGKRLGEWQRLAESGQGKPSAWAQSSSPFPPLFVWLVQKAGEDPAKGFQQAAEIYQARASFRTELALYGALPISILLLGQMVFWQIAPLLQSMVSLMKSLGDMGGN